MAELDETIPINSVLGLIRPSGDPAYYSPEFKQMVDDHINYMLNYVGKTEGDIMVTTHVITLDEKNLQNRYLGDWYGFLTSLNIPQKYHWAILRLNGTRDPLSLELSMNSFLKPAGTFIDQLMRLCKEKRT